MSGINSPPASAATGSMVILVPCESTVYLPNLPFPRKALVTPGSCYTPSAPSGRVPLPPAIAINDRPDRHAFRSLADRLSPYRRGPHGAVQLALRARPR